jgi:ferritin-like metal-binding protein YciE
MRTASSLLRCNIRSRIRGRGGGQEKGGGDAAADLSLIAAAQRVEHYEASGYSSARNLAQQLRTPVIVQLLSASLAEEENADQLLTRSRRGSILGSRCTDLFEISDIQAKVSSAVTMSC